MNVLIANISLDNNTLILLVLAIVSGISSWLQKKRKTAAEKSQHENPSPPPSPREAAPEQPDLQEVLRRLLGGEAPPQPPVQEPSPPTPAETQTRDPYPVVVSREVQPQEEDGWREEAEQPHETIPARVERRVEPLPQRVAASPVIPVVLQTAERVAEAARNLENLNLPARPLSMVVTSGRRRHSLVGDRAIAQVRNSRTVRQAFVASLVFGPPKSLENSQP